LPEIKAILQIFFENITVARCQFREYCQTISTDAILEITPLPVPKIDAENIEVYITQFLSENGLKRVDILNNKDWARLLIGQILKKSNLSLRKIAMVIGINRETVRKLSEEPSP
jgi:hypothetical protein